MGGAIDAGTGGVAGSAGGAASGGAGGAAGSSGSAGAATGGAAGTGGSAGAAGGSPTSPTVVAATFIGGPGVGGVGQSIGGESLRHCVVSPAGDLILGGSAVAQSPTTPGAYDTTYNGGAYNGDSWVGRMSLDLRTLTHATFIGGSANEREVYNLLEKANGQIVIAGHTDSADFPTTPSVVQTTFGGASDGFVSILLADLSDVTASTFLGGSAFDAVRGDLLLGPNDEIWLLGNTNSADYPTANAWQAAHGGGVGFNDGFISRLSADLRTLEMSTFFGGSASVWSEFIVGGVLNGSRLTFFGTSPSQQFLESRRTHGATQASGNGFNDMFVATMSFAPSTPTLESLIFFPTPGADDWAENGIVTDSQGNLYFQGEAWGAGLATSGAYDTTLSGQHDCVLYKTDPTGQPLWVTYLGGSGNEKCLGPNLDANGNVVITGTTSSADFPTTPDAFDRTHNGGGFDNHDTFVSVISADGTTLLYSSLFGGQDDEFFRWSCMTPDANTLYAVGWSRSPDFPTTPGTYQPSFGGGGQDMVVVRIDNIAR